MRPEHEQPRILVADDDRITLAIMTEGLQSANYEVLTARDGDEAIRIARSEHPDLALLDIRMPGTYGIEVARQLRDLGIHSIFMTACEDNEVVELATAEGALGYLVKPIRVGQLLPAVRVGLQRSAEIREMKAHGETLTQAIEHNRDIGIAIGMGMASAKLDRTTAFETFRQYARSNRIKMAELARRLFHHDVDSGRMLSSIFGLKDQAKSKRKEQQRSSS